MISALEHWVYCPRQCGLIHLEHTFDENIYTLRGRREHERVHSDTGCAEASVRVEFALPLVCERLGIFGKADAVEFRSDGPPWPDGAVFPVEYKHGPPGQKLHDEVQVCAQALCLEEMLGCCVTRGALFYQKARRRREVNFTRELRRATEDAIEGVREMLLRERVPAPVNDSRCPRCSLIEACQPSLLAELSVDREEARFVPVDGLGLE
ncbi:MAG: CRISPR-associated protein Cas4 [Armatimonadetes bacterium]|nr:CRISPR-associated protein Cas4 [Armatimonadota bacterium]